MRILKNLFEQNRNWAEKVKLSDPDFFLKLSEQQNPEILWIGCSDSRVPATQIVDMLPGQIFVHRNIANVVVHTDLNCLSVIQIEKRLYSLDDLFREKVNQRFSYYISRIGLPEHIVE